MLTCVTSYTIALIAALQNIIQWIICATTLTESLVFQYRFHFKPWVESHIKSSANLIQDDKKSGLMFSSLLVTLWEEFTTDSLARTDTAMIIHIRNHPNTQTFFQGNRKVLIHTSFVVIRVEMETILINTELNKHRLNMA